LRIAESFARFAFRQLNQLVTAPKGRAFRRRRSLLRGVRETTLDGSEQQTTHQEEFFTKSTPIRSGEVVNNCRAQCIVPIAESADP
jgi:hypothetical protein